MPDLSDFLPPAILSAVILGGYALSLRSESVYRNKIQALTDEDSIQSFGDILPSDLPPELLDTLPASLEVSHCFSGLRGGERVVTFKYQKGWGRQSRTITAVAVRRVHPDHPIGNISGTIRAMHQGWILTTGWMWPKRIVREWDALQTTSDAEGAELQRALRAPAGLHMLPRPRRRRTLPGFFRS